MPANPQKLQQTVTLFNGDQGPDFNRICDIGADAIQSARRALGTLPSDVPTENLFSDMDAYERFSKAVRERRVLEDGFANIVSDLLAGLLFVPGYHPMYKPLESFRQAVTEAADLSDRFLDLVASDKARGSGLPFLDLGATYTSPE